MSETKDMGKAPTSRRELEEKIVAMAWRDDSFRRNFLADPKGEFEKRLKSKLPAGVKISAHQEDENHLYFVIPAKPQGVNLSELSDEDLEKVAGGVTPVVVTTLMLAGVAAATAVGAGTVTVLKEVLNDGKTNW
jgi:hypothetical protein